MSKTKIWLLCRVVYYERFRYCAYLHACPPTQHSYASSKQKKDCPPASPFPTLHAVDPLLRMSGVSCISSKVSRSIQQEGLKILAPPSVTRLQTIFEVALDFLPSSPSLKVEYRWQTGPISCGHESPFRSGLRLVSRPGAAAFCSPLLSSAGWSWRARALTLCHIVFAAGTIGTPPVLQKKNFGPLAASICCFRRLG